MIYSTFGQLLLVLATLFTTTTAYVNKGKVGAECCLEDWQKTVGALTSMTNIDDTFMTQYEKLYQPNGDFVKMNHDEDDFEGQCFGLINYKCVGAEAPQKCECNTEESPFKSYRTTSDECIMDLGSVCNADKHLCGAGLECKPSTKYTGLDECFLHSDPEISKERNKDKYDESKVTDPTGPGGVRGGGSDGGSGYKKSSGFLLSATFVVTLAVTQQCIHW